jgi:hypothetical protein
MPGFGPIISPVPFRGPSGRSSGVEHNLAKVGVEGSNPFARSNFHQTVQTLKAAPGAAFACLVDCMIFLTKREYMEKLRGVRDN